jgi:hypothetical protein
MLIAGNPLTPAHRAPVFSNNLSSNPSMKNLIPKPIRLVMLLAAASPLQAAVLLHDSFTDLGYTNGPDAIDSQWRIHTNTPATTLGASTGQLEIGRIGANGNGFNPGAVTTFAPTTIAVGETIVLTFDAVVTGGSAATDGFRFGLFNSGGTNMTGDLVGNPPGTGSIFQNDVGYSVFVPQHTTGTGSLRFRTTTTTNNVLQISAAPNTSIATGSITTATVANTPFSGSLSIERTALNSYTLNATFAGNTMSLANYSPTLATETFDSLSFFSIISAAGTYQSLAIDNVKVETIPEPSSAALLALVAGACLSFRRRL